MQATVQRNVQQFKLVIFDLDGTLYKLPGGSFRNSGIDAELDGNVDRFLSGKLEISLEEARSLRLMLRSEYGKDLGRGFEEKLGIERDEYFSTCWNIEPRRYIDHNPLLIVGLGEINTPMALLSNAPQVWGEKVIELLKVRGFFRLLKYGDGEVKKPNERAYLDVTEQMKVDPSEAIMVEDDLRFMRKAKELGMTTIFIGETDDPAADYIVPDIHDAMKLLVELTNPNAPLENATD